MSKKQEPIVIFWFRRDLRTHDNHGFYRALASGKKVLPLFIFDEKIIGKLPPNDARISFIHEQLHSIHQEFEKHHSGLLVEKGVPINVFESLFEKFPITAIYTNHDYEPAALQRDAQIHELCSMQGVDFLSFKDQVIFEKDEILKADGNPYTVYTPYSKKWLAKFYETTIEEYESENELDKLFSKQFSFPALTEIGFTRTDITFPKFCISKEFLTDYENLRNLPSKNGTSMVSVHLRFGTISIRKLAKSMEAEQLVYLKELIWREFFMQILYHFPKAATHSFKEKYNQIPWRNNQEEFEQWCEGKTGYPMVDAGMRELNSTGYMHNRVRMVVASFLCKHLLIDWRWGEAYFASKLLDFELSSNNGNWQWAAGCGCDAAPYFRVFNPTTQQEKFDPMYEYIKKWVPEFRVDAPYLKPMVEHKFARERAIETYKEALKDA